MNRDNTLTRGQSSIYQTEMYKKFIHEIWIEVGQEFSSVNVKPLENYSYRKHRKLISSDITKCVGKCQYSKRGSKPNKYKLKDNVVEKVKEDLKSQIKTWNPNV